MTKKQLILPKCLNTPEINMTNKKMLQLEFLN